LFVTVLEVSDAKIPHFLDYLVFIRERQFSLGTDANIAKLYAELGNVARDEDSYKLIRYLPNSSIMSKF
jgi:hypothetical protein